MFSQQTSVCKHPEIIRELFAVLLELLWFVVGSPDSHICALISNWCPRSHVGLTEAEVICA